MFIVVRPHRDGYRVAVARHKDVPAFGPPVKPFYAQHELRDFLLSKAINAETACHKCAKFKQMGECDLSCDRRPGSGNSKQFRGIEFR